MKQPWSYPFTAIVGQADVKRAIALVLVNPRIGSLLISGEKGTAKSTLIRGMVPLLGDRSLVELPLHATEEQVLGGISIEAMVKTGMKRCDPGLLARANGNVLYVDEMNLLPQHIAYLISDANESQIVQVAREGISAEYESDFTLIGTMNPEEGKLNTKLLERFGLFIQVRSETDPALRKQIILNRLEYEKDPIAYYHSQKESLEQLKQSIDRAKARLPFIEIADEYMHLAAEIALQSCCEGHRADLLLLETAKAIAALDHQTELSFTQLQEAAKYVLPHRIRNPKDQQTPPSPLTAEPETPNDASQGEREYEQELERNREHPEPAQGQAEDRPDEQTDMQDDIIKTTVDAPLGQFHLTLIESCIQKDLVKREGSGKRTRTKTSLRMGRYVKAVLPKGHVVDVAFDATLRAAALYQKHRVSNGPLITIHSSDIRSKVREKRTGKLILFVVDASGSMGVNKRMRAVKSAILSLLQEAYQKRDKVGLITFADNQSHVLLEPTRSIERASKELREIPTGGNTPLALGIETTLNKLSSLSHKDADYDPHIVLITDGRANAAQGQGSSFKDALRLCEAIHTLQIKSMVVDTETGFIKLGLSRELANALGGSYYQMGNIDSTEIVKAIQSL